MKYYFLDPGSLHPETFDKLNYLLRKIDRCGVESFSGSVLYALNDEDALVEELKEPLLKCARLPEKDIHRYGKMLDLKISKQIKYKKFLKITKAAKEKCENIESKST